AEWLEFVRDFSLDENKPEKKPPVGMGTEANTKESEPANERIVLTWTGKLVVSQPPPSAEGEPAAPSRLTAGGSPARLSHPEGDAICSQLTYVPASGDMQLVGQSNEP